MSAIRNRRYKLFPAIPFQLGDVRAVVTAVARAAEFDVLDWWPQHTSGAPTSEVALRQISGSDLVVVDTSLGNMNVGWEAGVALALGKSIFAIQGPATEEAGRYHLPHHLAGLWRYQYKDLVELAEGVSRYLAGWNAGVAEAVGGRSPSAAISDVPSKKSLGSIPGEPDTRVFVGGGLHGADGHSA